MIPLVMAAGTVIQMAGNWASNMAQAEQEKLNAAYYLKQAEFVRLSQMRAERLADFDYTQKIGQQVSAYAGSGVDTSGSAAVTIGGTVSQMIDELWAIKKKGDLDYELASMRGSISKDKANMLSSAGYNLTQAATTGMSNFASTNGFGTDALKGSTNTITLNSGNSYSSGSQSFLSGQNLLGVNTYAGGN